MAAHLPESYFPAHYAFLDALPVTPSGKLDRWMLPSPRRLTTGPGRPPRTPA